jgi:hypothetical protein
VAVAERASVEGRTRAIASDVLTAAIRDDPQELHKAISFVLEFETYFVRVVTGALANSMGSQWLPKLRTSCESSGNRRWERLAQDEEWQHFTARKSLDVGLAASEFFPQFTAQIERKLGHTWAKDALATIAVRNTAVHGGVHSIAHLNRFADETVSRLLKAILDAALFFERCLDATLD